MAACPACSSEVAGDFPFCPFCGSPLSEAPPGAAVQERKVVSVLFCDLVGFTAASESADPEDVHARLGLYHEQVRDVLERHGGTVEKFVGDAVMAVFGAPSAHEDDAERAVRAGLRILETIEELNAARPALALQVRVGINTGEAVVAIAARPERGEGIVTGDVVNTASRLQGVAPVGGVAVSETTYRATERIFEWERLELVQVKGKADPLSVWRPLEPRARFGTDVTRTHTTPLVGRELERSLLVGTFERAAQQRSCQLVTVVGEPGVGKSRLCAELLSYAEAQRGLVRWRQGRCLPYGDGIAFWALGEIVKAECGILQSDTPAQATAKLEQAVSEDEPEPAWLLTRLAPLVGALGEPASQEESFAAWRRFCEGLAAERTTVLVFEDLHWADPALLAFLGHLADWAEGVPLLLLCTARPELYESHPTFGTDARNAQRINLSPLTDDETAQLVATLLERAMLPDGTHAGLLERAGGNPLYAEEFVRLLTDRGDIGDGVEVPDSVQALIAARLDTLSPERKSLLQDASVLGKVFWAGGLAAMGDCDPAEVEQALHELVRKELLRPARTSSMEGEREYAFWHVLVRDVCYGQIPRSARAARHEAAAAWLEDKAGERVDDLADVLAHHYEAALELVLASGEGDAERLRKQTVRYLGLAGMRALALDNDQAELQLSHALELCPDGDPARASLVEHRAHAVQQQGRLPDARDLLYEALELYREQDEPVAAGRVLTRLANVLFRLGDQRFDEVIAGAIELLEAQPPGPELVWAYGYDAGGHCLRAQYPEAKASVEKGLALAAELGLAEPAFPLAFRGLARCLEGDPDGVADMHRALGLALEQGLGREAAVIYGNTSAAVWPHQGPRAAVEFDEAGADFCRRRGLTELELQFRASALALRIELGETERALAELGPVADLIEATGDKSYTAWRGTLMQLAADCGRPELAPDPDALVAGARRIGESERTGYALLAAAELLVARNEVERARALVRELDDLTAVEPRLLFSFVLPRLSRLALVLEERPIVERLAAHMKPVAPLDRHALVSTEAQLAEHDGDQVAAGGLYRQAAEGWEQFGDVPERAYALLGQGRCLTALKDPAAEEPLCLAQELFTLIGYEPAAAQATELLSRVTAPAP